MSGSFEKSLKLTNLTLLFSGIRIHPSNNAFLITFIDFLFVFNLLWLYVEVFGEFFWLLDGIQQGKNFTELSLIAPCFTISLLSTAKTVPMFYYRKNVLSVTEKLRKIHPSLDDDREKNNGNENVTDFTKGMSVSDAVEFEMRERKIVKNATRNFNFIIHMFFYTSGVTAVAFVTLPLLSMCYHYYMSGEWELELPFLTKYYFDPFTKITWPIMYFHQIWSTFIVVSSIFGVDTFVCAFCTFAHIHFRILCHRFEHVVSDSMTETKEKLNILIKRHQELIELVDQVELMSSNSSLFNIITSSVLICLSGFNVTVKYIIYCFHNGRRFCICLICSFFLIEVALLMCTMDQPMANVLDDGAGIFAFFMFLMMSLSQISVLCLFGDLLMSSSMTVAEGVYNCRWYDTNPSIKRTILLILIRAQKPCRLTAAKFADLNLTTFTTILSRSWSFFALLRTVYDKR